MIVLALGRAALLAACAGTAAGTAAVTAAGTAALPRSALAVRDGGGWTEWWRSARAPSRYGDRTLSLASRVQWRPGADGVEWGELELSGSGEAWRTKLVVARLDPRKLSFALDTAFSSTSAAWSIARASSRAVVAVNAGQFLQTMPWGWVVLDGRRFLSPSIAPLVSTFTVTDDGAVRLTHATIPDSAHVRWAFQSYPTLLAAGEVPRPLRAAGCGIDVAHRDARLALGLDSQGRMLLAMTRFDALRGALDRVPFGLTTPEMSAVMGAMGAMDAVLLDGGISAQLVVRDATGIGHRWPGMRKVPLALVAYVRGGAAMP